MAISDKELLVMFAKELREIVESFEEEAEILADKETLKEIEESEEAYRRGEVKRFKSIEDFRKEIGLCATRL